MQNKIEQVKLLNNSIIEEFTNNIQNLILTEEKMLETVKHLETIQQLLNEIKLVEKIDYGPKPLYGYADKEGKIPYVKVEYIFSKFVRLLNLTHGKTKTSPLWKGFKKYLAEKYNITEIYHHVRGVSGYMLIWMNVDYEKMDSIYKEYITSI